MPGDSKQPFYHKPRSKPSFGSYLENLRREKELTQEQLAQKSKLTRAYITQLENDYLKRPSAMTLIKLADGLDVDHQELFEASGYAAKIEEGSIPQLRAYLRLNFNLPEDKIDIIEKLVNLT